MVTEYTGEVAPLTEYTGEIVPLKEYTGEVVPVETEAKPSFLGRMLKRTGGYVEKAAKGVTETGLGMATGALSSALGGIGGLARTAGGYLLTEESLSEAAQKGAEVSRGTQEAMTYQPRSKEGQTVMGAVSYPMEAASKFTGKVGGTIGKAVAGEKGEAAGTSIGEALPAIAATALPLKGVVKRGKAPVKELPPVTAKERQAVVAQEKGYVLPVSEANPTLLNKFVTGWGGKIQTQQAASIKNQPVTNSLAKRALGIAEDQTLSADLLETVRANAGRSYRAVKESGVPIRLNKKFTQSLDDLSKDWRTAEKEYPELAKNKSEINDLKKMLKKKSVSPTAAIEMVKDLRASAKNNFRAFTDPSKVALARAQRGAADALDILIEDNLGKSGKAELVGNYKKARELIAKTYDVEAALSEATGNVNAIYLGKLLKKRPLTGELRDIARFAQTFEKSAKTPESIGAHPGISPLDIAVAGIEAVPALAAGRPGIAAGAIGAALGRPAARTFGLSDYYQRRGGSATRTDAALRNKQALRRAAPAAAVGAIESQNQIPMSELMQ